MAAAISPATGRAYGVARVCDGFGVPRSSFYAWRRQQERIDPPPRSRRGPKPAISDAAVLSAIRTDLDRSPWIGEGHRKVWARLRVLDGIRVARKRVLRLMRENVLLSPHRHLPRQSAAHDGHIITEAPNLMWGTDATQIPTVLDGKVWLFAVVDHWNAEGMGWHISGKLTAWHHRLAADRITPFMDPVRFQLGGGRDGMVMAGTDVRGYDVPHQLVEQLYRDTGVRTNPLRGIGVTANKFATEAFMDEVARKRGADPLAFRLELLKGTPRAYKAVERVAQMAEWGRKRDGRALGLAYIDYSGSQVAGIAEVSLDRTSGQIKMHNFWCTIDCGVAVQPDNVIAQTESSIVYGLGLTLSERISIKDGQVEQSNFYDYSLPRMNDVPEMHIDLIRTDNHPTGAGQMATPLIAPTVSNAIMELMGVRLRHSPFTPERVKKALA